MKKILLTASTAALLCGCGGPNYSITGNAGLEPGDSVFLIGSGRTELAAGMRFFRASFFTKLRPIICEFRIFALYLHSQFGTVA